MPEKRKKYPLWFEETFEKARSMEEQFHRMMADMWREPAEFKIKIPRIKTFEEGNIPVDIIEEKENLIIRAAVPGFDKDEISIKLNPNTLEINAQKKKQKIEQKEGYYKREMSYGSAHRILTLPVEIIPEESKAKFENGMIEITAKKAQKKKSMELKFE